MKKYLILSIFVLAVSDIYGQQLPYSSQYMFNDYLINPAVAGSKGDNIASLTYRSQWTGLNGAPTTFTASIHGPWGKRVGFGALLFNDNMGPFSTTGLQISYAYRFEINKESKISLGLSGMFYQYALDKNELALDKNGFTVDESNDNAIIGGKEKAFAPDAAFGIYYYTDNFYAGFSVPQLFQNRVNFSELNDSLKLNKLVRHYFLTCGYKFEINEDFDFEPSLLFKAVAPAPIQLDINAKATYKEMLWLGASYRTQESVVVMLGFTKSNFIIGYSYDITLTNIKKYSSGSHEIYLGMKISPFKGSKGLI